MKLQFIIFLFLFPVLLLAQGMPSEQFVLYKVWASDSTALKNLGYGEYIFSSSDTVVLEGSDVDTVVFTIVNPRGFFNVWITPDTANFAVDGSSHDHAIGTTDSLSLSYRPKLTASGTTGNAAVSLDFVDYLDWNAEENYYESLEPPVCEYLEFYIEHTGVSDTSAVIIEIKWQ